MHDAAFLDRPTADDRRLLTTPPHAPRPHGVARGISPAVEAVRQDPSHAGAFWERLVREGTPLVEGEGAERTYTWAHRGPARRVALVAGKLTDDQTFRDALFAPIEGTDLWTLTLRLGSAWRCTYGIAVDDGEAADPGPELVERRRRSLAATQPARHGDVADWYDLLARVRPDRLAREEFRGSSVASGPDAPRIVDPQDPPAPWRFVPVSIASATGRARHAMWALPPETAFAERLVVLLDGDRRLADGPDLFAAWAHTHLAPRTAVLLLGHGDIAARDADLTANPALVDDLHRLICTSPVPVTDDPERTLIQGSSLGGLAALFAQCIAPDRFGASVCQSGSFWWPNARSGHEAEWLTRVIRDAQPALGSVHLSVGTDEWVLTGPVRRMRDAVAPLARTLDYEEFDGGHDAPCWEAALPGVLRRLGFGPA